MPTNNLIHQVLWENCQANMDGVHYSFDKISALFESIVDCTHGTPTAITLSQDYGREENTHS